MDRLDKAYRILGVAKGASNEEIRAAYEELKSVWDLSRFGDEAEMLARAEVRLKQIDEAYRLLRVRGRERVSVPSHPWLEEKQKKRLAQSRGRHRLESRSHSEKNESPSLFDDAFSERVSKPGSRVPRWVLASAILLLSAIVFFVLIESAPVQQEVPTEEMLSGETTASSQEQSARVEGEESEPTGEESLTDSQQPTRDDADRELRARTQTAKAPSPPSSGIRGQEATDSRKAKERPKLLRTEPFRDEPSPSREDQGSVESQGIDSSRAEKAFLLLKEESQAARELFSDQVAGLRFVTWKALPKEAAELWIDLTAEDLSSGERFHFIWAVDPTHQRVRPMSQAARDLELGRSRM